MNTEITEYFNKDTGYCVTPLMSRKLRDLGFCEICRHVWHFDGEDTLFKPDYAVTFRRHGNGDNFNDSAIWGLHIWSAPTIYQVAKWIREMYGVHVEVKYRGRFKPNDANGYEVYATVYLEQAIPHVKHIFDLWDVNKGVIFPTYEKALLQGLATAIDFLIDVEKNEQNDKSQQL